MNAWGNSDMSFGLDTGGYDMGSSDWSGGGGYDMGSVDWSGGGGYDASYQY